MLWNVVYEFFVKYIFGGYLLDNYGALKEYYTIYGFIFTEHGDYDITGGADMLADIVIHSNNYGFNSPMYMSMGNYLSFIATLITMVAIVLICCALIKKIYNMCAHIIG